MILIGGIVKHGKHNYGFKITTDKIKTANELKMIINKILSEQKYKIKSSNGYYDTKT